MAIRDLRSLLLQFQRRLHQRPKAEEGKKRSSKKRQPRRRPQRLTRRKIRGGGPQNPMHAMAAMSQNPMMARQRYPPPHAQQMPPDPYAQQQAAQQGWYPQQQQAQQQYPPPYRPQYPQQQGYPGAPGQGYYPQQQQPQRPYYPPQQQQYGGPRYPAPQQNPYGGYPMDQQQQQTSGYGYPGQKPPSGYPTADWQGQQAQQQQNSQATSQQPQRPSYPPHAQQQQQMYSLQTEIQTAEAQLKSLHERGPPMDPQGREYIHSLQQRIHYMRQQLQQMQQAAAASQQQQHQMATPPMYPQGSQQSHQTQQSQVSQHQPPTPHQAPTPQQQMASTSDQPVSVMQTTANQVQVNITPTPETSGRTLISVYHQYNSNPAVQTNSAMPSGTVSSPGKDSIPPEPTPSKIEPPLSQPPQQSQMMTPPQYASVQQTQVAPATSSGQPPTPEFTYNQQTKPSSSTSTIAAIEQSEETQEPQQPYSEPAGVVESSTGDDVVVSSGDVTGSPQNLTNGDDEEGPSSSYSPDQAKADESDRQSADEMRDDDEEEDQEDGRQSLGPLDADSSDIPPESENPILDDEPSAQSMASQSSQNDEPSPEPSMTIEVPIEDESSMASESMDAPPSERTINEDEEESNMSQPVPEIVVQEAPAQDFPAMNFAPTKKRGGGSRKKSVGGPAAKKRKKAVSDEEDFLDDEDRDYVVETSKRSKKKAKAKAAIQQELPLEQEYPVEYIEKRRSTRKRGTQHSYKEKHDLDQEELAELLLPSSSNDRRSKSRTIDDSRASTADGGELTPMPNDDGDSMAPSEVPSELLAPLPSEWVVEKILGVRIREKKPIVKEEPKKIENEAEKNEAQLKHEAPEVNGQKKGADEAMETDKPGTSAEMKPEASPDGTDVSTLPTEASSSSTSTVPTPSIMEEEEDAEEFLIKFKNKSYLHCEWHTMAELEHLDKRAAGKITRFKTKQANLPFQTDEDEYFNEDFTVVERVLDEVIEENGDHYFFVKWRSLSYEECTWELAEIVPEERVQEFRERNEIVDPAKAKEKSRPSEREWTKLHPEKTYKDGNKLREYQFIGVDWLLFCYYNKKNCILADEMGLGKTVQTITFLQGVYDYGIHGPFLVVVPLSTLHNWEREFETWTNMNAVVYHGGAQSRQIIQQYELYYQNADSAKKRNVHKFDALITTFEMVVSDCEVLKRIPFRVCVIDEAHRLKNRNCKLLTGGLLSFKMEHRVLLTGTPLQNNIHELFSLLNFLEPLQFHSSEQFLEKFGDCKTEEQVQMLQEILKPMMLRRLKEDVEKSLQPKEETIIEVQLSNAQKKYYRAILERNFTHLCKGTSAPSLMNTMMELRKCCNHPFLINGAEETILGEMKLTTNFKSDDELLHYALIQSSGKLVLIDKLLPKLRKDGHKVLIFSQMVRVLDILEEFLVNMNYPFERIDGNVRGDMRQAAIDRFSKPDSDRFVFLLCTRAGGLGINLTAADTVIIFDSDWNPQNDLQAQARCHRIGQKKMVKVYRLITSNTYEREMFDKASLKLGLDKAVLQSMAPRGDSNQLSRKEVEQLLKKGAYGAIMDEDTEGSKFNEEDIDTILQRRTHTITLEAGIKGSTFAKATFNSSNNREDIDVNDPNFWAKWAKKANIDTEIGTDKELIMLEPRNRRKRFEENKNDEEGSDGDNTDSEQGSTKNGRGKSTRASMMNGGRKRRRGHDDDDDDYVSYTPDELAFNKSEFFKVEKLVAMWGWGRWSVLKEQIDSNLSENDIEHIARTLLLHCIREYRGDEKTREFVWKLITPAGGLVGKGGYMPAPAGRKGQINTIYQEGWAALPEYNPPAFAVDSSFQRHVHRHANKLLSRVHHLQILGSQITGGDAIEDAPVLKKEERKEEEKELLKEAKESEPKEAEAKEEEPKEKAGEAEAKEALEADGKPKENSEAEAAAPKTSEELPKINGDIKEEHKDSEAEKAFEEAVLTEPKAAENGESLKVKSEADSTEEPSIEKPAEVEENDKEAKEVEEAPDLEEKPAKLQKEGEEPGEKMDAEENRSQKSEEEPRKVKRTPYDIANVPMIADPMMPIADWDINCDKHLLIGIWKHGAENYEAIFTDPELCFCKKQWSDFPTVGDLNGRFKRLIAMYQRAIEAAIAAAQQMAVQQQPLGKAYRWPKRDEQEFIRVLRIYGVKDDTNTTNIINWSRFKELSPILTKKSDSELLEELYCVLAMCTKQQGGELSVVDQRRASMVDLLPKMKAEKLMNRLHLMRKIHAIITTGIQSIKTTLRLCSTEAMPNGWNEEQDEMLLTVVDKFGLDNISVNVARVPAFQKIIRPEEKTLLRRVIEICTTLESGKWNGPASTEMIDDGPDTEDIGALFQGMQNSLNSSAETLRGSTPTSSSTRRGRKRGANAVDPIEAEKEKMRVMMHQNYLRSQMDQSSYSQAISALITQQMMLPLLSGQLGGSSSSTASQAQQIQQLFNFAAAAALATPQVPAASTSKSKPTGSEIGLNLSTKEAASNSATAAQTPKQSAPSTPAPAPAAVSSKPSTSSSDIDYSDLLKKAGFPGDTRVPIFCEEDGSRLTGDKAPTVNSLSLYLAANPKYKIDFNGLSADKPSTSGTSLKAKEEPTPSTSSAPAIKRAAPSPALEPGEIPRSSSTSKPSTSGTSSSVSNAPVAVYHKKNGLMLAANKCPPLKTLAAWLDKHPDYNVHSSSVTAAAAILPKMYQERLGGENNIAVSSAASTSAASNSAAAAASAALLSGLNPSAATAADLQMQLLLQQTMMSQALYGPYAALLQQPSLAAAAVQATPTSATSSSASSASQKDHNQLLLELMSNPLLAASMLQANTMNPQAQMLNQLLTLDLATAAAAAAAAQATTTSADAAGASKKSSAASASSKNSRGINAVLQKLANP
ncbi:hypothetical protein L596_027104 [Steinernema carpocapsae]|uniref:Chromodomain-helicase-DNA-binding protein 7 n=1 Tax=Steinernema carpocapsae TaxID=34508 RepID=A0A4V5ZYD7_STECR|nr:hypothetical protein L596_027104 [Steinernema carpocapsae]